MPSSVHDFEYSLDAINSFKMLDIDLRDLSPDRKWTPDGDAFLIELYQKAYTADRMAEETGRRVASVLGRIYELGERGVITPDMWGSRASGRVAPGPTGLRVVATGIKKGR